MRRERLLLLFAFLLFPGTVGHSAALDPAAGHAQVRAADGSAWAVRRFPGRPGMVLTGGPSAPLDPRPERAALHFLRANAALLDLDPDRLTLSRVTRTPVGPLFHFRERAGGLPVFHAQVRVLVLEDGRVAHVLAATSPRTWAPEPRPWPDAGPARAAALRRAAERSPCGTPQILRRQRGYLAETGEQAWRFLVGDAIGPALLLTVGAGDARVRQERRLRFHATLTVQIFEPNPVNRLNDISLRDMDDADAAVPPQAYTETTVQADPPDAGRYHLRGPYAHVTNYYNPGDRLYSSTDPGDFRFTREPDAFEQVNAYTWVTRSGAYIEGLGFTLANRPIAVEPHANLGVGAGALLFPLDEDPVAGFYAVIVFDDDFERPFPAATRTVDAAEEADVILHEHFHTVIHGLRDQNFSWGTEPGAIHEGSSDYWSARMTWEASIANGFDPHCLGEWWTEGECYRRTDSTKVYPADMGDPTPDPHHDGEIWSSFLVGLAEDLGWDFETVDRLLLMGIALVGPLPSFLDLVDAMVEADRILFGGAHTVAIRNAADRRGINILPTPEVSAPGSGFPLRVERAPGGVHILWQDLGAQVDGYHLYEGRISDWIRFEATDCNIQGNPGPAGYRAWDWSPTGPAAYYLVTAYANEYEGTAGYVQLPWNPTPSERNPAARRCDP